MAATDGPWKMISYKRLNPSRQEFRLLELLPARSITERLVCRIITVRLEQDTEFLALSALYGDEADQEIVTVNGRNIAIRAHHAQALRHVRAVFFPSTATAQERRPKPPPRWLRRLLRHVGTILPEPESEGRTPLRLWLDALCVDQLHEREKLSVQNLRHIYESAKMVIGWLGPKDETSDAGLAVMKEIDDAMPPRWGDLGDEQENPENYSPHHKWAEKIQHIWQDSGDGQPAFMGSHWMGANDFMNRPYFQRRWILEEIAMASFPAFLIGDTIVSWRQVLRLNRFMEEFKDKDSSLFPPHLRAMIADLPLGTVHALLDEFVRRRQLDSQRALFGSHSSYDTGNRVAAPTSSYEPSWNGKMDA
ncbi:unnamed protein product [Discula destructiva]